jgi:photosystem II stability/assembly factor-like uncharacterized protein
MKKLYILAIALLTFNLVNAQWVIQNSSTTDTLDCVFFIDANSGYALGGKQNPASANNILLKTTTGGTTWTELNVSHLIFSVYFTDASNGYISGTDTIFKTTNGGVNWLPYPLGLGSVVLFDIHFYDPSVGYATAWNYNTNANYMVHTTNAGVSWTATSGGSSGTNGSNSIFCTDANTCYVVGFNGNHGIFKTTNGGTTWNNIYDPSMDCFSVYFTNATNGVVVGGDFGSQKIYQTTNEGSTWNQVYNGSGSFLTSVCFADANNGIAVGSGGFILKTNDGGATWSAMTSPTTKDLNGVHFPTANTVYAVGATGTIIKYTGALGIEETGSSSSLNIYPNPANDIISFIVSRSNNAASTLDIYNVMGCLVKTETLKQDQQQINVGDLSNGIYLVEVKSKGVTGKQKMLIQR